MTTLLFLGDTNALTVAGIVLYLILGLYLLVSAARRGQWVWLFAMLLFHPFAVILYAIFGYRTSGQLARAADRGEG